MKKNIRWMLVLYDLAIYIIVAAMLLGLYDGMDRLTTVGIVQQIAISVCCIFLCDSLGIYMDRFGDTEEFNVIFAFWLQTALLL